MITEIYNQTIQRVLSSPLFCLSNLSFQLCPVFVCTNDVTRPNVIQFKCNPMPERKLIRALLPQIAEQRKQTRRLSVSTQPLRRFQIEDSSIRLRPSLYQCTTQHFAIDFAFD